MEERSCCIYLKEPCLTVTRFLKFTCSVNCCNNLIFCYSNNFSELWNLPRAIWTVLGWRRGRVAPEECYQSRWKGNLILLTCDTYSKKIQKNYSQKKKKREGQMLFLSWRDSHGRFPGFQVYKSLNLWKRMKSWYR